METHYVGLLGFLLLLLLIGLRVPVAFALTGVGVAGVWYILGLGPVLALIPAELYSYVTTFSFTAVPLFLLMGEFAFRAGLVSDAYQAARKWLSRLPGGLAVATVTGSGMFGACSGSGVSAAAAMGRLTVPEMLRYGYNRSLATGSVASAATIAVLVPPSIILVLYALFTEQSLGLLFIAAYIPGLLSILLYCVLIVVRCARNPELAPPVTEKVTWFERFRSLLQSWGIFVLFAIILGGIYFGLVAPTEAAALAASAALVIGLVSRRLDLNGIKLALFDTARLSGMIFIILVGAAIFGRFITLSGLPGWVTGLIIERDFPVLLFLLLVCVSIIALGAFMDAISMMLLLLPVLLPVLQDLDVNLIWFGIIFVKLVEIGAATPPFGITVFVVKGVLGAQAQLGEIFRGIWWFLSMDVLLLTAIVLFPSIVLWLPSTLV